jgi:hypothetical protein
MYLLGAFQNADTEVSAAVNKAREEIRGKHTENDLRGEIEKSKADLHVVVLMKLIEDAVSWVYSDPQN